jgi:hypothetical protein
MFVGDGGADIRAFAGGCGIETQMPQRFPGIDQRHHPFRIRIHDCQNRKLSGSVQMLGQ